jgi:hypothetical protein
MQATETEFNKQHRQRITATLNSNANGLKTFLFGFFTKFNLGAIIRTVDKYATLVEFEGPATLVMRAKEKLDVGLKEAFPGVIAEWEASLESTEIITKVTILETSEELKRCDSSGKLKEIDVMERDSSVSGMTSYIEMAKEMFNRKNTDRLISIARLAGFIKTEKVVITINHRPTGNSMNLDVTILTFNELKSRVLKSFNLNAAVKIFYTITENKMAKVDSISSFVHDRHYYVVAENEEDPTEMGTSCKFKSMDSFYEALKQIEDWEDIDTEAVMNVFKEQRVKLSQLSSLTDAKLKEYGLVQGGLREAVLSVIEKK